MLAKYVNPEVEASHDSPSVATYETAIEARSSALTARRSPPADRSTQRKALAGSLERTVCPQAPAQWQSLWLFYEWIFILLFLFLAFSLHEFGGLLPSGVRFAFVAAARAIRQLVLRRDVERFFVAD